MFVPSYIKEMPRHALKKRNRKHLTALYVLIGKAQFVSQLFDWKCQLATLNKRQIYIQRFCLHFNECKWCGHVTMDSVKCNENRNKGWDLSCMATSTVWTPGIQLKHHKGHTDLVIPLDNNTNNYLLLIPQKWQNKTLTFHQCRCSLIRQTPLPDELSSAWGQVRQAESNSGRGRQWVQRQRREER